jgi:signal transduction histidine kinase
MQDISLHMLDIVDNSIRAGATEVHIYIEEDPDADLLRVAISDNGEGMDAEMIKDAVDPFFTSKKEKRVGLGLPLLAQAAREGGGTFELDSEPGKGTRLSATFQWGHPDRKPVGDVDGTVKLLKFSHPEISFVYTYTKKMEEE